ncbi:uncharacterized protein LOC122859846 [Aphidius gifuensis]|uniref:uncharacterized protein LOC122859846 n=1 Tax=Aphidius gifuensis TaxID=684658 RepID=UPI001CDC599D|nr:uncharacterized protein LOC122859846 [Aphidius gifuensis]
MNDYKRDVVRELHAPARKNFLRREVDIRDKDETWQADLVEMIEHLKVNSGYNYILTVIDIFSKFSWAVGLKNKTGKEHEGNYEWLKLLPELIERYNNTKHRTIKMKPVEVVGYKPNWTNEIFTIIKINKTSPVTYKLKDYQGNSIQGSFYTEELQKVRHSDIYLIEKVLKRRGNKMYVKYLGFDNSHNQWIDNQ